MNNHFQHTVFNIKQLNNRELLLQTKLLVQKERDTHIQVLRHLAEIDSRKLYFRQGFSSLFDYAVRELGYSEGAAYRRIKAMKLCRDLPETASRLQSGRLSLSVASQLQVFFEKQDKKAREEEKKQFSLKSLKMMKPESKRRGLELEKEPLLEEKPEDRDLKKEDIEPLRAEKGFQGEGLRGNTLQEKSKSLNRREKESLMEKVEGCSSRIAGKLLSEADPSLSLTKKEKVRFLGTGQVEIKIVLDKDCHKNLEELKHLLSHKDPGLSYGKLLGILSKEALQKHDPRRKKTRRSISRTQATQGDVITENKKTLISINKLADTKRKNLTSASKLARKDKISLTKAPALKPKTQIEGLKHQRALSVKSNTYKKSSKSGNINSSLKTEQRFKKISRYISSYLRKYIWTRDGGQCAYVHQETKRRCSSRHLLQIDPIQPFALGGKTEKENLRLLCAGHNQYRR